MRRGPLPHTSMAVRPSRRHWRRPRRYASPAPSSSPARCESASSSVVSCGNSATLDVYFRPFRIFLLACAVWFGTSAARAQAPSPAPAQETAPPPAVSGRSSNTSLPLGLSKWSSWKFESEGDHLHLINQAAIEGPNLKFFADDVDLYVNTNKVVASGNVVFTNADGRISAERVEFDTGTGIGTFYDASGIMSLGQQAATNAAAFGGQDPDVYFYGAKLEKLGPRKYRI